MLFKIVFLACLGFPIVFSENSKLDDLNSLINQLDHQIRDLTSKSTSVLRPLQIQVGYYASETNKAFINNLTIAAQPYWSAVSQAEKSAKEHGRNIDACIETGNSQLYATNDTYTSKVNEDINSELTAAKKLITDSYDAAVNDPIKELEDMHERVKRCNDEACAGTLIEQLNNEFTELSTRIPALTEKANDYTNKEFIKKMEHLIVPQKYHDDVHKITSALESCISKH